MNNTSSHKTNPNATGMYEQLMKNNPKFAKFVEDNQGKTPEQIATENGIDPMVLKYLMR